MARAQRYSSPSAPEPTMLAPADTPNHDCTLATPNGITRNPACATEIRILSLAPGGFARLVVNRDGNPGTSNQRVAPVESFDRDSVRPVGYCGAFPTEGGEERRNIV